MKNLISTLFLAVSLFTATNVFAQIGLGGRVGVNIANWNIESEDQELDTDGKTGIDIALVAKVPISDLFSIQPELHFLQKGYKVEETIEISGISATTSSDVTLNYFELPILARFDFGTDAVNVFGLAGPSFGFGFGGEIEDCSNGDCSTEDVDFEEDEVKQLDVSLTFGAGVGFNVGPGQLFVDARYLLGLTDLNDSDDDSVSANNRGIQIGLGYLITLGN